MWSKTIEKGKAILSNRFWCLNDQRGIRMRRLSGIHSYTYMYQCIKAYINRRNKKRRMKRFNQTVRVSKKNRRSVEERGEKYRTKQGWEQGRRHTYITYIHTNIHAYMTYTHYIHA